METKKSNMKNYIILFFLIPFFIAISANAGFAASTGQTAILRQIGSGAATASGDYISSRMADQTVYRYYIEVPAGVQQLTVDIYDADIGARRTIIPIGRSVRPITPLQLYLSIAPTPRKRRQSTYNNISVAQDSVGPSSTASLTPLPATGNWS